MLGPRALVGAGVATGWRLSLESAGGSITIVMPASDRGVVNAVRRFLLDALGNDA
jgi:hypothetical protein